MWKNKEYPILGRKTSMIIGTIQVLGKNARNGIEIFALGHNVMGSLMASNAWTVVLGGNIDLSITISVIVNLLGCGEIHLKYSSHFRYLSISIVMFIRAFSAFTAIVVHFIFTQNTFYTVLYHPYEIYASNFYYFTIPLCVGVLIQLLLPRATKCSETILRCISPIAIILSINSWLQLDLDLFVFKLFTWDVRNVFNFCFDSNKKSIKI